MASEAKGRWFDPSQPHHTEMKLQMVKYLMQILR